jgi:hypothetical protein
VRSAVGEEEGDFCYTGGKLPGASVLRGGKTLGLTIHFEKSVPDALEQWLSSEARYIIGTFGKPSELQKIYGARTDAVMAECRTFGENIVKGITMILDVDLRKLHMTVVRLQNGKTFIIDRKYALVDSPETSTLVDALLLEDGPRVFSVTNK